MAAVSEIKKLLNREQMNRFGVANGVENAADEAVYADKQALAEAISPKVTPEQLADFVASEKNGGAPVSGEPTPPADPATTPPAPAPNLPDQDVQNQEQNPNPAQPATPGEGADTRTDQEREIDEQAAANGQSSPVTDEQAQARLDSDPALTPAEDDAVNSDIEIGNYVYYPHKEAQSGYRRGRVTATSEDTVEVVWSDGSRREFSRGVIRLSF